MEQSISLREYYLWQKGEKTHYPWERQFLNWEFLKFEEKRVRELAEWHKKFRKSSKNSSLESASFYVVPAELNYSWKAAVADYGNFNYVGLGALYNSTTVTLIGLIPRIIKQPQDYRLIDITRAKKVFVVNRKLNMVESCVLIEDWNYLRSDSIYVDVPYEKKIICKLINENLIDDSQISLCIQSPIISAPFGDSIGGISLSSVSCDSTFAQELVKIIQRMVPPEYRTLPPPKIVYNGYYFPYMDGALLHLAERPFSDNNVLSSIYSNKYNRLDKELSRRCVFSGEYSIFSAINPPLGDLAHIRKELLKNFTATEITLSEEIDKLWLSDIADVRALNKVIDEDLWIQVVYSRQYMPGMNANAEIEYNKIIEHLVRDFDTLLSDYQKQDVSREYLVRKLVSQSGDNLKRISQSIARSEGKDRLNINYFKQARAMILDNFNGILKHSEFRGPENYVRTKKSENPEYSVIQTEIINQPSSASEIFEAVKSTNLFKDIYDLQKFLDWLHVTNHVIVDGNKRYIWVTVNK